MLEHPLHSYLFVGPPGVGKEEASRAFATALLCDQQGCGSCHSCRMAAAGNHPDLLEVRRTGAAISVDQAREVIQTCTRMPAISERTVVLLPDFHLVDEAAPALLKTIEEPPPTTVIVVMADSVTPRLVTVASRCVEVAFAPLPDGEVAATLIREGVEPELAERVATLSGGRLDRARRAASDPSVVARSELWRTVPDRLDGTGACVATIAGELLASIEDSLVPLTDKQSAELEEQSRASKEGRPAPSRVEIVQRHKREQRRVRTEELRYGFAILAASYRDRLVKEVTARSADSAASPRAPDWMRFVEQIDRAGSALERNPNEALLVESLLLRLSGMV